LLRKLRKGTLWALAQFLLWSAFAVCLCVYYRKIGSPMSWRELLISAMTHFWATALLAVPLMFLTLRFARSSWWKQGLGHLIGLAVYLVAHPALTVYLIDRIHEPRPTFMEFLFAEMMGGFIQYAGIVGFTLVVAYNTEVRKQQIEEASLRDELAQTRLRELRAQIQPEFLFSTFRQIAQLMETDTESARSMMARLSDMLRIAFDSSGSADSTLRESLKLFECYLDLEKARLGDNFRFTLHAQSETLNAMVPRALLQSVVEAVLHTAAGPLLQSAFVNIEAGRAVDMLRMAVEIGGPGLADSEQWSSTTTQTGRRLQDILPGNQGLRWITLPDRTLRVEMEMPFAAATTVG
jgi:sensor histidine kinase YesM